jgi:hypothetical protein
MANNKATHPYVSSSGNLVQAFTQFRKAMPGQIDASILKKLGIAPGNESVVINVLRFLSFIDDDGKKTSKGSEVFLKHDDVEFAKTLEKHVKNAYSELFELRGDEAWSVDRDTLIGFFRATDETSALTAKRQAIAFETLSALSGHGEVSSPRQKQQKEPKSPTHKKPKRTTKAEKSSAGKITNPTVTRGGGPSAQSEMALTVRIEVNLPAQADQKTYDRIFKSLRANLLDS